MKEISKKEAVLDSKWKTGLLTKKQTFALLRYAYKGNRKGFLRAIKALDML